jgi:orotidine-5'-phosphate decarboxylase
MHEPNHGSRLIVGTNEWRTERVAEFIDAIGPHVAAVKIRSYVGLEHMRPLRYAANTAEPIPLFIDDRFVDDPRSVREMCAHFSAAGVSYLTVHAHAGVGVMQAAVEGVNTCHTSVLAVLELTTERSEYRSRTMHENLLLERAHDARYSGISRIVCNAADIPIIRQEAALSHLTCFVPGIRPWDTPAPDATRFHIAHPEGAVRCGADYLILDRSINRSVDPIGAVQEVNRMVATCT